MPFCAVPHNRYRGRPGHVRRSASGWRSLWSDIDKALRAARSFHLVLADIAGNDRIHRIIEDLVDEVRRPHYLLPNVEGHITSAGELRAHALILGALRDGNGQRAAELVLQHLNEVAQTLVKGFAGV